MSSPPSLKRSAAEAGLSEAESSKKVKVLTLSPSDPLRIVTTMVLYDLNTASPDSERLNKDLLELIFEYAVEEKTWVYLTGMGGPSLPLPAMGPVFHALADAKQFCSLNNRFRETVGMQWKVFARAVDIRDHSSNDFYMPGHEYLTPC